MGGTYLRWVMGSQVESGHACGRREVGAWGCLEALLSLPSGLLVVHTLPQTPVPFQANAQKEPTFPLWGPWAVLTLQNRSFFLLPAHLSSRQAEKGLMHFIVLMIIQSYNHYSLLR